VDADSVLQGPGPAKLAELRIRRELSDMLVAEYVYWRAVDNPLIDEFAMGAMGAVSNVLAALIQGKTPDEYQTQIAARDGIPVASTKPTPPAAGLADSSTAPKTSTSPKGNGGD